MGDVFEGQPCECHEEETDVSEHSLTFNYFCMLGKHYLVFYSTSNFVGADVHQIELFKTLLKVPYFLSSDSVPRMTNIFLRMIYYD